MNAACLPPLNGNDWEGKSVSIVRIGLAETKGFSDGYDAIFGNKKKAEQPKKKAASAKAGGKKKSKRKK